MPPKKSSPPQKRTEKVRKHKTNPGAVQAAVQAVRAAVGSNVRGSRTSEFRHVRDLPGGGAVFRGQEFLGSVQVSDLTTPGSLLFTIGLAAFAKQVSVLPTLYNVNASVNGSQSSSPATRVGSLMRLWSRFRFRRARLHWVGVGSLTAPGAVAIGMWSEPSDRLLANSPTNYQRLMACYGAKQFRVNETGVYDCVFLHEDVRYTDKASVGSSMTDADIVQHTQGVLQIVATGGYGSAFTAGEVMLEYEIELYQPELPSSAEAVMGDEVVLTNTAAIPSTTNFPLDPSLGTLTDVTETAGLRTPEWWDKTTSRVIESGDYLVQLYAGLPGSGMANQSGNMPQLNATSTWSNTLTGLYTPKTSVQRFAPNGSTGTGLYLGTFLLNLVAGQIIPGFINWYAATGTTFPTNSFTTTLTKVAHLVSVTNPYYVRLFERHRSQARGATIEGLEDVMPWLDLVRAWVARFPSWRMAGTKFIAVFTAGEFDGVTATALSETIESDLTAGVPSAQLFFPDLEADLTPTGWRPRFDAADSDPEEPARHAAALARVFDARRAIEDTMAADLVRGCVSVDMEGRGWPVGGQASFLPAPRKAFHRFFDPGSLPRCASWSTAAPVAGQSGTTVPGQQAEAAPLGAGPSSERILQPNEFRAAYELAWMPRRAVFRPEIASAVRDLAIEDPYARHGQVLTRPLSAGALVQGTPADEATRARQAMVVEVKHDDALYPKGFVPNPVSRARYEEAVGIANASRGLRELSLRPEESVADADEGPCVASAARAPAEDRDRSSGHPHGDWEVVQTHPRRAAPPRDGRSSSPRRTDMR